jgi:long-chain acyl-CoA synthetase
MPLSDKISTVPSLLRNVVESIHSPESTFLVHKKADQWENISFKTTLENADAISAFFLDKGIAKGDRMGLMIENGPDYIFYDQGIQQIAAINVSIYPTLSAHEVEYIINDSGMRAILVGNTFLYKKILKIAANCRRLEFIIPAFPDHSKINVPADLNVTIVNFEEVLATGKRKTADFQHEITAIREELNPAATSSLVYTSGTTGTPKGVMLSHNNFVENVKVCLTQMEVIEKDDLFLSFLPLSHVFERTATYHVCCTAGCTMVWLLLKALSFWPKIWLK